MSARKALCDFREGWAKLVEERKGEVSPELVADFVCAEGLLERGAMREALAAAEPRFVMPMWGCGLDYDTNAFVELWVRVDAGEADVAMYLLPEARDLIGATEGGPRHRDLIERSATWLRNRGVEPTLQGRSYPMDGGRFSDVKSVDGRYIVEAGRTQSQKALYALAAGCIWCHAPYDYDEPNEPKRPPRIFVFVPTVQWGALQPRDIDRNWFVLRSETRSKLIASALRRDPFLRRAWTWRERGGDVRGPS